MSGPSKISLHDPETCWRDPNAKSIGYFSKLEAGCVDGALIAELETMAKDTRNNVRLSLHSGPEAAFHEMIICQQRDKPHPPKRHDQKAKSFHVIKGEMAVYTFDAAGNVTDAHVINGASNVIYRVNAGVFHADFPLSDLVVHHESTTGPFVPGQDSVYAPWMPEDSAIEALLAYRDALEAEHIATGS